MMLEKTHRIRGKSEKYALWAIGNEACVAIGGKVVTRETRRVVFHDVDVLFTKGLVEVNSHGVYLTDLGYAARPSDISQTSYTNALKFFLPGVRYFYHDQHCVRVDGGVGNVSRYVTEVMIENGVLEQLDSGHIVLVEARPKMTLTRHHTMWFLRNHKCHFVGNTIRTVNDNILVSEDASILYNTGLVDGNGNATMLCHEKPLNRPGGAVIKKVLDVFINSPSWLFDGEWVVGSNGGQKLARYDVERLVAIGKLQIDTGGYITLPEERQRIQMDVTASELEAIKRCTTSPVTLIKRPATA